MSGTTHWASFTREELERLAAAGAGAETSDAEPRGPFPDRDGSRPVPQPAGTPAGDLPFVWLG